MPRDHILLLGDGPEILEVGERLRAAGRSPVLVHWPEPRTLPFPEDPLLGQVEREARAAEVVIEFIEGSLEGKREALEAAAEGEPELVLSSAYRAGPTEVGSWLPWPDRVAGLSGLFPIGPRRMIELQRGLETTEAAWTLADQALAEMGLEVELLGDHPGGVQARLVAGIINEAASLLSEEGASAADIDVAMKLGTNYPRGPLEWADHIGLDRVLAVLEGLEREYREDRYRSTPLLRKLVLAGRLGRKCGRGFFTHPPQDS